MRGRRRTSSRALSRCGAASHSPAIARRSRAPSFWCAPEDEGAQGSVVRQPRRVRARWLLAGFGTPGPALPVYLLDRAERDELGELPAEQPASSGSDGDESSDEDSSSESMRRTSLPAPGTACLLSSCTTDRTFLLQRHRQSSLISSPQAREGTCHGALFTGFGGV